MRVVLLLLLALALHPPYQSSIRPLPPSVPVDLMRHAWHPGCPVSLSGLRVRTVSFWGFDQRAHTGQLVINRRAAAPLSKVFRRLYRLHFPIRHMRLADTYGPAGSAPHDGDVSASFECRQAVPSPCSGG